MSIEGYRLAVDFGTSSTVAVLARPDAPPEPVLFDGSPLLPSAVCVDARGLLLVGRDALQLSLTAPERFEPHPKRRIDEGAVLLGDEVPVVDLIAAVFARVVAEVRQVAGGLPGRTVVTCPASWGALRRQVLVEAATAAGLLGVELVVEPVAAAFLLRIAGDRVPGDAPVLVYDFGAGTFDATLVAPRSTGFDVLATRGLDDAGGVDIDAAVVAAIAVGDDPAWQRLRDPATAGERRAARQLWDGVRLAKESLARLPSTSIHVPSVDTDVPLGREQLEELARPVVQRTVEATRAVLDQQGVRPGDLAAVLLVGGGSRLPLVATELHRAFGVEPMMIEQPELVVAKGAALAVDDAETVEQPPAAIAHDPAGRGRPAVLAAFAAAVAVAAVVAIGWWSTMDGESPATSPGPTGSTTASPTPRASPSSPPAVRPPAYSERVTVVGKLDMSLDGSVESGHCSPLDGDDGRKYHVDGADSDVLVPRGVHRVRVRGFVVPDAIGCGGRERLWLTELTTL